MSKSSKKAFSLSAPNSKRFLPYPYTLSPTCQLPREKSQTWSYTKFTTLYISEILKQCLVFWQKSDLYHMETWYFLQEFLQEAKHFHPDSGTAKTCTFQTLSCFLLYLGWAAKIKSDTEPRGLRIFSTTWSTTKLSFSKFISAARSAMSYCTLQWIIPQTGLRME